MAIERTDVVRGPIDFSSVSNTELNAERLPEPEELKGMELRFRVERRSEGARTAWRTFAMGLASAHLYAAAWWAAPPAARWLWDQVSTTEGMPVVAGMLGAILLLIALLSLVFVPGTVRVALATLSIPLGARMTSYHFEQTTASFLVVFITGCGAAIRWGSSLMDFHSSWLSADPQLTTLQGKEWLQKKECGWHWPTVRESGEILNRYINHDVSLDAPGVWIAPSTRTRRIAIGGLLIGSVLTLAYGVVGVLFGALFSMTVILALCFWAIGKVSWLTRECEKGLERDDRKLFQQYSDRLRNSNHVARDPVTGDSIREAEHLFLGIEPQLGIPILLHQPMLHEHVHIGGRTGSGKTSMALMTIMIQLIKGYRECPTKWSKPSPIVVVDLKGDEVLFQTAKAEAKARGQTFRFFTLEKLRATFCLNPFTCFKSLSITPPQLVQLILDALGLFYGFEYGKQHFSEGSRMMLAEALRNPDRVNNFRDLDARLQALYKERPKEFHETRELRSTVQSLTYYEQLITTQEDEDGDRTIRFDRVLENREVVYFWLPTTKESISAARLGRVVLLCLRVAAHDRKLAGEEKRQVYLLIDEFQKLASEQFEKLLQQARSDGIAAILANQSIQDLKSGDHDLMQTVRTNTRTKMHFSVTEPDEIQAFRELSGEELQTYGMGDVEEIRLRLSTKELASLSDHPKRLLLQITSGGGYSQFGGLPIPVETDWPISKQLADERLEMAWPDEPKIPVRPTSPPGSNGKPPDPSPKTPRNRGPKKPPPRGATTVPPPELKKKLDDRIRRLMDD